MTIDQATDLLKRADTLFVDGWLVEVCAFDPNPDHLEQWLMLSFVDEDDCRVELVFYRDRDPMVSSNYLVLVSEEGVAHHVELLVPMDISEYGK